MLNLRKANASDIPLLARVEYEASLPPLNQSFWDEIVQGTETPALAFVEAMLKAEAGNWGNAEDFWVLEEDGKPVAAAAGYVPGGEDYRPLNLERLDALAAHLGWSTETTEAFRDRYQQFWGHDPKPIFLKPQAPFIIETVAVLPEARGRGLGKTLVQMILDEARALPYSHAGIMVINGNDRAQHTYESVGFKPYQTYHADFFAQQYQLEFPGFTKFCCSLN